MTRLERIATHYGIATNLFVSLNIQDKLISVEKNIVTPNFYERFAPGLLQLPGLDMYEMFNIEEVKDLNPDAFIVPARMNGNIQSLKEAGIPTIIINPEGMESIKNTILYLGNIMGVQERAQLLVEYLTVKIEFLKHLCAGIKRRPPVYFCSHLDIYRACSRMMIQNELIEMGGGINVSANSFDSFWPKVSIEQVYEWNPEYIFYPPYAPFDETTFLEAWGDLTAVKEKKVFRFPSSLEAWDYPVHSSILGALWIAAKLHPDLYSSNALVKDIEDYYSCFYHVKFSAKELI